jgi:hypothetical protein
MDSVLTPVSVSLAFRLGEITLFERPLLGFADRRHFTRQEEVPSLPSVPAGAPLSQFYFFPCYPVAVPPPVFVREHGWIRYTPYSFKNYYVDVRRVGTFEQYLSGFSSKSRSTLKRKVKKFAEASGGEIDWRWLSEASEMEQFLQWALPLSKRTYQDRLLGSGLPATETFAADLRSAAAAGEVIASLLFLSGAPVAYVLCFCRNGVATYDYVGFDPDAQALSPGTVLQYLLLEKMFAAGRVEIFDFTEGEGAQKQFFATDHRLCAKTYVLRSNPINWASIRAHRFLDVASTRIGVLLDQWGLKARLKKFLRR